jgi:hypothetical protein
LTRREQLFEKEFGKVDQLHKTLTEDVPSPTYALPQLLLDIENSEVDLTEVVPGMQTPTDAQLDTAARFRRSRLG